MTTFLSKEVQEGLQAARLASLRKSSRLRVLAGDDFYPVLSLWRDGFSVEAAVTPPLRGLVDLYEGTRHLCQCLIVASESVQSERHYDFKRSTQVQDSAPVDFYRDPGAPAALLPR